MKIVYLDQNKWIELSKQVYGRKTSPQLKEVLKFILEAQDTQRACFPLSLAHYMETHKHGNPRRRSRLGRLMLRISKGVTIASPGAILRHELDVALSKRFPSRVRVQPFELLGYGISHMDPRIRFHLSCQTSVILTRARKRLLRDSSIA